MHQPGQTRRIDIRAKLFSDTNRTDRLTLAAHDTRSNHSKQAGINYYLGFPNLGVTVDKPTFSLNDHSQPATLGGVVDVID